MATSLLRAGYRLMLLDLDERALRGFAGDVATRAFDVRDAAGWDDVVADTVARFGRLDLMLNVAGFLKPGNVHEVSAELLAQHMDVNAKGVMFATRAGARQMIAQRAGHIINVASIAGLSHVPGLAAYAASKHAVRGFSLSVAHELRPHGVYVSTLCPDAVETPMLTLQEAFPEARMTFASRRALSVAEVEQAVQRLMRTRELELVLDVPFSGRAAGAKLANMFPRLTGAAERLLLAYGERMQRARTR
jgi:short-subunit dehydrogenase